MLKKYLIMRGDFKASRGWFEEWKERSGYIHMSVTARVNQNAGELNKIFSSFVFNLLREMFTFIREI